MAESLIVKYRPNVFEDVVGQPFVSSIQKKCASRKVPNAFLFSGVRGTGKTTTARIVAMSLNCENPKNGDPCLECNSCKSSLKGVNPNIKEMDMATNRGIEQIRDLQKDLQYTPINKGHRVIILDEAHQITPQGASALLKPLEEPPKDTLFILCTTDPQKLLNTIKSRCEKYDFKRVDEGIILKRLQILCDKEKVEYEEGALEILAKSGGGSVRDSESLLSQYINLELITISAVEELLNIESDFDLLLDFLKRDDKVSILRYFKDNSNKITDESWLSLFVDFLISKTIKENSLFLSNILSVFVEYMRWFNSGLPPVYLQLIFLKLAESFQLSQNVVISDFHKLAGWFNCSLDLSKEYPILRFSKDLSLVVVPSEDYEVSEDCSGYILMDKISEILKLSPEIDKNELIDINLVVMND